VRRRTLPEIEAKYNYRYDDADNMLTKVEPFRDNFNDGDYSGWSVAHHYTYSAPVILLDDFVVFQLMERM
jgi:hypothetical protein